jgi:UDP-glucose 4-epimerase
MSYKNILVTGGAGFIGSHLCEALIGQGHKVTCLDNLSTGSLRSVKHLRPLRLIEGNANHWETFEEIGKEKFDVLFHYAATVGVRRTEDGPDDVLEDVRGIRHLARLAQEGKIGKIIYASSSEVYGDPQQVPEVEKDGMMGWSPYTTVKLYGEHMFQMLWSKYMIPTVSLRFFNVYGPRQLGNSYGFVTADFIQRVLKGDQPTVFGDGKQTRDFVYIDDNIRAALAAMEREEAFGQVVNVGTGRETSIGDWAKLIIEVAGKEKDIESRHIDARQIEIGRRCASIKKMKKVLGMSCNVLPSEGIEKTIAWEEQVRNQEKNNKEKKEIYLEPATSF